MNIAGQAESTVELMLASAGFRGQWGAIRSFLGRFPLALHQILFRARRLSPGRRR